MWVYVDRERTSCEILHFIREGEGSNGSGSGSVFLDAVHLSTIRSTGSKDEESIGDLICCQRDS
jgi:hypothetical protein